MDNGTWTLNGCTIVPENDDLWCKITAASYDHATAGHPRIKGTLQLVAQNYWWPRMADFITAYVKGCTTCQATKPSTNKPKVSLYPITSEKLAQPFSMITLDLIVNLPKSGGYDLILTITDHDISKAALFFPCNQTIGGMGVTSIFAQQVFPHFGVSRKVISDQDTRFTLEFTKKLCRLLDINQNISIAYHPQTDCHGFVSDVLNLFTVWLSESRFPRPGSCAFVTHDPGLVLFILGLPCISCSLVFPVCRFLCAAFGASCAGDGSPCTYLWLLLYLQFVYCISRVAPVCI